MGKKRYGCDMFKVKQMIVVYDAFFRETIDCSVGLRYARIRVIVSSTTEDSALMKMGSECRTVIGKLTVLRPHETCFMFID
jgi:hypothetical protein